MTHGKSSIACPRCGKKYAIPSDSIGPDGRTVKCVACLHSWNATPDDVRPVTPLPLEEKQKEAPPPVPPSPPTPPRPETERKVEDQVDGPDFPMEDEEAEIGAPSKKSRLKLITAIAGAVAALAVAGTVIMLQQDIRGGDNAVLRIRISEPPVRQQTADGGEAISTTAEIMNSGTGPGRVPELRATMRTPDGQVVRQWKISPPAESLAPNSTTSVQIGTSGPAAPSGPLTLDVDAVERQAK